MTNTQGAFLVIGVALATISTSLQAAQIPGPLPATILALELSFLVSGYLQRHYPNASRLIQHVAVLFGAVALMLAISMSFLHPQLQLLPNALFPIAFLIIIILSFSSFDDSRIV